MDFQHYQRIFTARIRDPRSQPRPPGAPAQRMRAYEALIYNNLESFLLACFPVCRKLLGKTRWTRLVRAFLRDHVSATPYFREIPAEFLGYLHTIAPIEADLPGWLSELAHYEWVELALDTSDADHILPPYDEQGDLLNGHPLPNPVMRVLAYRWPVHRLAPRFKPTAPPAESTLISAYRGRDLRVHFLLLNPASARLLNLLQDKSLPTGEAATRRLAEEMDYADLPSLMLFAHTVLHHWRDVGVLLGSLREP